MKSEMSRVTVNTSTLDLGQVLNGTGRSDSGGWGEIASRVSSYVSAPQAVALNGQPSFKDLSGLLKLQLDVTQYQLRVEVVSKVADSAVTSMRKLQQTQ